MDIEALDRFLPTRPPGQVHAEHFALQKAGRWTYLVAWNDDGVPVGVGVIRWEGWSEEAAGAAFPACPEITNLQVHEARRGRGVGTALIQAAEEQVRGRGFSRTGVAVADDNPQAAKLYARLGYADSGLRSESRYTYPDDSGVPREIVEYNALLVKDLAPVERTPATARQSNASRAGLTFIVVGVSWLRRLLRRWFRRHHQLGIDSEEAGHLETDPLLRVVSPRRCRPRGPGGGRR